MAATLSVFRRVLDLLLNASQPVLEQSAPSCLGFLLRSLSSAGHLRVGRCRVGDCSAGRKFTVVRLLG